MSQFLTDASWEIWTFIAHAAYGATPAVWSPGVDDLLANHLYSITFLDTNRSLTHFEICRALKAGGRDLCCSPILRFAEH